MIQLTKVKFILFLAAAGALGSIGSHVPSLFHSDKPECVPAGGIDFLQPGKIEGAGAKKSYGPTSQEGK